MAQKIQLMFFYRLQNKFIENSGESFLEVLRFPSFSRKNGSVFVDQICHFRASYQHSIAQKVQFSLFADFRTSL